MLSCPAWPTLARQPVRGEEIEPYHHAAAHRLLSSRVSRWLDRRMRNLETLPTQSEPGIFLAVIEASQGSSNKLKYVAEWDAFTLAGALPLGMFFPYEFGFLPSTLGEDGDPVDVLVLADAAVPPGTVLKCRVAGVIEAEQEDPGDGPERNDRIVAIAEKSHRYRNCHAIDDIAANVLDEIEAFFTFYNAQKGGRFAPLARRGIDAATALIEDGRRRFAEHRGAGASSSG